MKNTITTITMLLFFIVSTNAQLIIDDFATGKFDTKTFNNGQSEKYYQKGNSILGKEREVQVEVGENLYNQKPQLTIKNKSYLAYSSGYDVNSHVKLAYGYKKNGLKPLNLDLSGYKMIKIEFIAKTEATGMYLTIYTNNDRAVFSSHVPKSTGKFIFEIPFNKIKKVGGNFTFKDVDHIRFRFDSRSKTGCNMAINKIWFSN